MGKRITIYYLKLDILCSFRKDLDKFLTIRYEQRNSYRKFWCYKCVTDFPSQDKLKQHEYLCSNKNTQILEYPLPGEVLQFSNFDKQYRSPLTGFV